MFEDWSFHDSWETCVELVVEADTKIRAISTPTGEGELLPWCDERERERIKKQLFEAECEVEALLAFIKIWRRNFNGGDRKS